MRPYVPPTRGGHATASHDIHHKTADLPPGGRAAVAKKEKHAARQHAKKQITAEMAKDRPCSCGGKMIPHHYQTVSNATWLVCSSLNCDATAMVSNPSST